MKASAIILKRKVVRYEGSDENPGELSKHHSVKSTIDLEDLNPDTSRIVLPSESRWAKFFKPGEVSLTENELLKRKEKKFSNHRFYLQLNTLCDRIKIIQGDLTEEQKQKLAEARQAMVREQARRKEEMQNKFNHKDRKSYYGSIKKLKGKLLDSVNSTAKKNLGETIHEKDEPKPQETVSEESIRSLSGDELFNF